MWFSKWVHPDETPLLIEESGDVRTWGDVRAYMEQIKAATGGEGLAFFFCRNAPDMILAYFACLWAGVVPLLLDEGLEQEQLQTLRDAYQPNYYILPQDCVQRTRLEGETLLNLQTCYVLKTKAPRASLHQDLALLLTTSGSTGSPKLVRLGGKNLHANASAIAQYLQLSPAERPITMLPMQYSYGMSVLHSHALVGAPIVVTQQTVMERGFWELVRRHEVTSLVGVPYTYKLLQRAGLMEQSLPSLRYLTQAGGKLPEHEQLLLAQWAQRTQRRFIVMYGQTETAPRMSYLPSEEALQRVGSIGIAIPGGVFTLEREEGEVGELVYHGENVAMGYAQCRADLARGDDWQGELHTGDLARQDADGYYYIVGRKKRFLKIFGTRVGLDEVERLLSAQFESSEFACVGADDALRVYTTCAQTQEIAEYLLRAVHIPLKAICVETRAEIPKTAAGKTNYQALSI